MHLAHHRHLAYCTNIHRGESWLETFAALREHTLRVKERVCPPGEAYGIGLRLSDLASRELAADARLRAEFRRWLDTHGCYVFTINGFPYGKFHGTRVKEQVYAPDWTTAERLEYTCRLFDLLAEWLPGDVGGSVSTVPGSFKGFAAPDAAGREAQVTAMCDHLRRCGEHAARLSERTGHAFALALEPEPLCWFENTEETLEFFGRLGTDLPIGVCFDTCHFAVEFEEARAALQAMTAAGIPIAKLHLSSALRVHPTPEVCAQLGAFRDQVYLHQTVARRAATGKPTRWLDLDVALAEAETSGSDLSDDEWRIHFHVPLHAAPALPLATTASDSLDALDWLTENPNLCPHVEMETYTWEVLPPEWHAARVEEQLAREYRWTFDRLRERSLLT